MAIATGMRLTDLCSQGQPWGGGHARGGFGSYGREDQDLERAIHFYREVLGLEILRLEAFRAGKESFVSARIAPETLSDIRPLAAGERGTPNMDHDCLVLGPTDMHQLQAS